MNDEELESEHKKDAQEASTGDSEEMNWMVAPRFVLREKFGLTAENRPTINLNPENVPDELRALIPYAEAWGIGDDLMRGDVIGKASTESLKSFVLTVRGYIDVLYKWLAGPEADLDENTEEYHTFSAMLMAYEEAKSYINSA